MKADKIDKLNVLLVALSLAAAVLMPFKLFVFSYLFLGPLHYLTEINWLESRNYFTSYSKTEKQGFYVFSGLIPLAALVNLTDNVWPLLRQALAFDVLLMTGFICALAIQWFKQRLAVLLPASYALSLGLNGLMQGQVSLLVLFVPTLVHVYLFTLLFIIYGARRSSSQWGYGLFVLLLLVPAIVAFLPVHHVPTDFNTSLDETMRKLGFDTLGQRLGSILTTQTTDDLLLKIQVFMAFAYTYHYLNWFSKTSIIGWREAITSKGVLIMAVAYACIVGLYYLVPSVGLKTLFFVSMLHVVLEFPLNAHTIKELFGR